VAYALSRWKNVALSSFLYQFSRRRPERVKRLIRSGVRRAIGPDVDVDTHFKPRYEPWDQRLCLVPDNDLFVALREGKASVVTDTIETFDETGIQLGSGAHLDADIIVTATGLELLFFGGAELAIDGEAVELPSRMTYRGMMLSGVPNLFFTVGYTNASWTLRADLVAEHVCRILNHMRRSGDKVVTPNAKPDVEEVPLLDLKSGYVERATGRFPKQGAVNPWNVRQNYLLELLRFRTGRVADPELAFTR
jgi:cation diffusion facilitator CzcD-associated flavoprotein CzcO